MHTEHLKSINIHHALADIKIEPHAAIRSATLKRLICAALDNYAENDRVTADTVHKEAKERHGTNYQTSGYYLKLYRLRKNFTQKKLATLLGVKQHHLSEIENNKRVIGKKLARQIADVLDIDYRKFL